MTDNNQSPNPFESGFPQPLPTHSNPPESELLASSLYQPIRQLANQIQPMIGGHNVMIMLEGNEVVRHPQWQQFIQQTWGFDYNRPANNYPFAQYLEIVDYLKAQLYPILEPDDAYQKLGYNACQTYFVGLSGQVIKIAARVMGPIRGAQQFVKNMQRVLPWDGHALVAVRPGYFAYRKSFSGGSPALMLGFMQASAEAAGVTATRLTYHFEGPVGILGVDVIHEIEWN